MKKRKLSFILLFAVMVTACNASDNEPNKTEEFIQSSYMDYNVIDSKDELTWDDQRKIENIQELYEYFLTEHNEEIIFDGYLDNFDDMSGGEEQCTFWTFKEEKKPRTRLHIRRCEDKGRSWKYEDTYKNTIAAIYMKKELEKCIYKFINKDQLKIEIDYFVLVDDVGSKREQIEKNVLKANTYKDFDIIVRVNPQLTEEQFQKVVECVRGFVTDYQLDYVAEGKAVFTRSIYVNQYDLFSWDSGCSFFPMRKVKILDI